MGMLGTWRDVIKARLEEKLPEAHVVVTADHRLSLMSEAWRSPAIFIEFPRGTTGPLETIGSGLQTRTARVRTFIAIRNGQIDVDSGVLEYAEDSSGGMYDLIDKEVDALQFFEVQVSPNMRLINPDWDKVEQENNNVVFEVAWDLVGDYIQEVQ